MNYPFNMYPTNNVAVPQMPLITPIAPQPTPTEIPRVSGMESIRSFPMAANSSMIFVSADPNSNAGWIVTTDAAAYKTITPCKILPDLEEQPVKAGDLEAKLEALYKRMSEVEEKVNTFEQSRP